MFTQSHSPIIFRSFWAVLCLLISIPNTYAQNKPPGKFPELDGGIIGPGEVVTDNLFTLSWNKVKGSVKFYELQERPADLIFGSSVRWETLLTEKITSTPIIKGDDGAYEYRLRVCPQPFKGICSEWSEVTRVEVQYNEPLISIVNLDDILVPAAISGVTALQSSGRQGSNKKGFGICSSAPCADLRWPNGEINFEIQTGMDINTITRIIFAIRHWEQYTVIRFFYTGTNIEELSIPEWLKDEINFRAGVSEAFFLDSDLIFAPPKPTTCSAFIGRVGVAFPDDVNEIKLGNNCSLANAIHEIGHTVGLLHEHQRPDRDTYVEYFEENVDTVRNLPERIAANFSIAHSIYLATYTTEVSGAYDYKSRMHYRACAFLAEDKTCPTDVVLKPIIGPTTGNDPNVLFPDNNWRLSAGDIAKVTSLYGVAEFPDNLTTRSDPTGVNITEALHETAWVNENATDIDGQGWHVDIVDNKDIAGRADQFTSGWFTFDPERADGTVGWYVTAGPVSGNYSRQTIFKTDGGRILVNGAYEIGTGSNGSGPNFTFRAGEEIEAYPVGSGIFETKDGGGAAFHYDIQLDDGSHLLGSSLLTQLTPSHSEAINQCEPGDGAWVSTQSSGQGFFMDQIRQENFDFIVGSFYTYPDNETSPLELLWYQFVNTVPSDISAGPVGMTINFSNEEGTLEQRPPIDVHSVGSATMELDANNMLQISNMTIDGTGINNWSGTFERLTRLSSGCR